MKPSSQIKLLSYFIVGSHSQSNFGVICFLEHGFQGFQSEFSIAIPPVVRLNIKITDEHEPFCIVRLAPQVSNWLVTFVTVSQDAQKYLTWRIHPQTQIIFHILLRLRPSTAYIDIVVCRNFGSVVRDEVSDKIRKLVGSHLTQMYHLDNPIIVFPSKQN